MRKIRFVYVIGLVAATVVVVTVFLASRPRNPSYVASYFFDESRFTLVKPGMSADEVRDLIGPPLSRGKLSGREEYIWTYSSMPAPMREWTDFEVRFDASRRTISATRNKTSQEKDPATGQYRWAGAKPPRLPEPMSIFPLNMVQGESPRLGVGQDRFLIQVMASWCGGCNAVRPQVEALLSNVGPHPIKLLLVSIDEDEQSLHDYLQKHNIQHLVAWDPQQSLPGFAREKGIPKYALLQDGMISWFDFEHAELADQLSDLSWFIR